MSVALMALIDLAAVAWMTYIVGTEMRNRAKGWKAVRYDHDYSPGIYILQEWKPAWKRWAARCVVYSIRKVTTRDFPERTLYYAGCFAGTYEEAIARLDNKARSPIEREWYLDQLRKASLS
mgnify:CR=1 FL=1